MALEGGGWLPWPGLFTPGKKTWYPLYRKLGWPQGQSGWVQKILPPLAIEPCTIQLIASRYTILIHSTCKKRQVLSPTVTFLGSNPFTGDDILVSQTVTIFTFTPPLSLQIPLEMKLCMKIQVFWVVTPCHWACSS